MQRKQHGLTLIELGIVISLIMAATAVTLALARGVNDNSDVNEIVSAYTVYAGVLTQAGRGATPRGYTDVEIAALPGTPETWKINNGANAIWPWGVVISGAIESSIGGARADSVRLDMPGLSKKQCEAVLPLMAARTNRIWNNTGTVIRAHSGDPVTTAEVTAICNTSQSGWLHIRSPM